MTTETATATATAEPPVTPSPPPSPGDRQPRTAASDQPRTPRAGDKPPTVDPEAPYGWMTDPKTGERRPKKRPGKQAKTEPPPRDRPNNRARKALPPPAAKNYAQPVGELAEALWMIMAAAPVVDQKIGKINLAEVGVKVKAQAAILKDNATSVVNGLTIMAEHSKPVARGLDKLTAESGPAWVLPAMFALLPFVGQSAAMWKAPVMGDVTRLAERTEAEWTEFIQGANAQTAGQATNGDGSNPG